MKNDERAEKIGKLRDILSIISEEGPSAPEADKYQALRDELVADSDVYELLPEFVIDCRNGRHFWDYIQRAFQHYVERRRYIEAQLLPIERQFRPERANAPGIRPPEVRIEYSPIRPVDTAVQRFVSENRIAELRAIDSTVFDLRKLIRFCEELNVAYADGALLATAMLARAILDHVPPIFGMVAFSQVANNCSGSKSFKETMRRLDEAARKIADEHLHSQIRKKEILPEPQQVNFAAEVDLLLAEIVRKLS